MATPHDSRTVAHVVDWLGIDQDDPIQRLSLDLLEADRTFLSDLVEHRRAHLTQDQVAIRMGVSQSAVSQLEAGDRDPLLSTVRRYALALGVRVEHHIVVEERLVEDRGERIREDAVRAIGGRRPNRRGRSGDVQGAARDLLAARGLTPVSIR